MDHNVMIFCEMSEQPGRPEGNYEHPATAGAIEALRREAAAVLRAPRFNENDCVVSHKTFPGSASDIYTPKEQLAGD